MTERESGKMMAVRQAILRYVQDINWMKKKTPHGPTTDSLMPVA